VREDGRCVGGCVAPARYAHTYTYARTHVCNTRAAWQTSNKSFNKFCGSGGGDGGGGDGSGKL